MIDNISSKDREVRVLMDAQAFDIQTHGGISRCFAELISHMPTDISLRLPLVETKNIYLKQKGLAPNRDYYMEYCKGHPTHLKRFWYKLKGNVRAGHWSQWDRMPRWSLFETERLLLRKDFDVFHPTYYDTYFLNKIGQKPFVLTIHDMIPELYDGIYKFKDHQINRKRKLVPRASHIIAVSEQTKQDIVNLLGVAPEKISVIYHGIDQTPYVPNFGGNEYGHYLLYVGERGTYKNFKRFVHEVSPILVNHSNLSVVCTGKPFDSEETRLFETCSVRGKFVHRFVRSDEEMMNLYHHAQAFVYPSEYEGFGIPILEAYRAGCPVVLNHASCFPEIAGDSAIYFVFDGSGLSLQEQLVNLLAWTPAQRQEHITLQYERLRLYSWEKAAQDLAEVYRKVAKESISGD